MKFRKIEIQAFRAYRNFQDGTFDFVVPTGETADFISIYAPNGFGKTSFYDAVEWGMTNNISRMLRREKEYLQDVKTVNEHDIIRNKNAEQKDNTFVRLYTDTEEKPIVNQLKLRRGAHKDFSFSKKATFSGKEYFQEVILSQEWIDAFLKEDNAEKRYEKFMQAFGDENIYRQYNIYSGLIKLNESKIKELDSQLKNLQTQLNFDFDADILSKINTEIITVNQKGETLPTVDANSTEKHMFQLANSLSDRITDLNSEIENLKQNIDKLERVQLGQEDIGVNLYFDSKIKSEKLKLQLEELDKIKKLFIQLRESENKLKTKTENTEQIRKRQRETNRLIVAYPQYQIIAEQIKQYNTSVSQNETLLNKYNEENLKLIEACNILNIQVDAEREKIEYVQKRLNEIPKLKADLTQKSKEKKSISEQIDLSNSKKKESDELLTDIEKGIVVFDYCTARLNEDDFYSILNEKSVFYEEILNELIDRNKKIEQIILTNYQ
ncbi:AAA family ATPase [Odoribacter laneus]|uniref:AAA family ATPase n=1 Tax=Odoribacter laneus TaxID=626933 RepID=UPI003AF89601